MLHWAHKPLTRLPSFTIIDDEIGLVSAETMDCDNNGKIDHYKLTFSASVTDSSFPGYSANSLGSTTSDWNVSGYTNVKLRHGTSVNTACGVTDTANDSVLYIAFTEGASYDTGAKPDITTTATPGLSSPSGNLGQVFTATVTEVDRAKPVIVSALGTTSSANLTVTFSEAVYGNTGTPACGSGGELTHTKITYANNAAGGASSLTGMGTDTCAASDMNAIFVANASFATTDGDGTAPDDAVTPTANLYDAANNAGNTSSTKAISIVVGTPTITSIELYDTNGNGNIDQFKVVFNVSMNDATIDNADANRFTMGGTAATVVDQRTHDNLVSGLGGTIASPNNDPSVANDNIVTLFTDDVTVQGTNTKTVAFTQNTGRWQSGTGFDLLTATDLTSVTLDKAPPVIISAVASYVNSNVSVDSGDTLTITFSEATDKSITTANINSVLTLSSGHAWGGITSITWNMAGDVMTITFSGSASTVAVGDFITIVNTLRDTASTPNESISKVSINPITGSFGLDTTPPYLIFASDITTNSVIVQFSEGMNASGSDSTRYDRLANYTIIEDPANGGCPDVTFTGGTLTVISPSQVRITLPGGQNFCNTNYRVTVATTVTDLAGNQMGSPNYLTFVGLEPIKVIAAQALSSNTVRITFSKPPLTGNNVTFSAECNTTYECGLRYKITPTIGDDTITSAVVGSGTANYTVTLTHNGTQSGLAYTVIVANATDGDNFNNGSVCIEDLAGSSCVQSAPNDRATFIGTGTVCSTLSCGTFFDDPFVDGTTFSFAFKYDNKIYLGTNDKNDAAFRFDPVGTNAILTTFKFINNAALSLTCSSSIRFGYIISGITGGTCGTNGGANGEVGAVGFTSVELTIGSNNYEILAVGALKEAIDRVYYTQDKDTVLDMRNFGTTGGNGINTASTQLIYGINNYIFTGVASDHGTNAPVFNRAPVTDPGGVVTVGTVVNLNGSNIPKLGKQNGNPYNSGGNTVGIDFIYRNGSSTYMANNGGLIYIATSNMGTMAPSNNSQWNSFATDSTPSTISGTSLRMPDKNATNGGGLGKVRPGEKAYPYMLLYNGRLYLARNVGTVSDGRVPLRGELWKCTPNGSGQCAPGDWSRIITGSETDLPGNAKAISMLISNGNGNLYIGFDDPVNGLVVYKNTSNNVAATSGTLASAGWTQQGVAGLGSGSKYIINSASLYDNATAKNYLYIVIGNGLGTTPIKVVRQVD